MTRSAIESISIITLALFLIIGCSTTNSKENIKKIVREEIKSELKSVHDFLNVAYAYDINPESLESLARMNESIKALKLDIIKLKKTMIKARLGSASGESVEGINKEIERQLSKLDKKLEIMLDEKIVKVIGKTEDNRLSLKEHKLDIKSNTIDMNNNRVDIRDNVRENNERRVAVKKNVKELEATKLLLAKEIERNENSINVNKKDISQLKKSSARLMLNINKAK